MINAHKPKIMLSPDISDSRIRVFNLICKKNGSYIKYSIWFSRKRKPLNGVLHKVIFKVWGESSKKTLINHGIQKNKNIYYRVCQT